VNAFHSTNIRLTSHLGSSGGRDEQKVEEEATAAEAEENWQMTMPNEHWNALSNATTHTLN